MARRKSKWRLGWRFGSSLFCWWEAGELWVEMVSFLDRKWDRNGAGGCRAFIRRDLVEWIR